MTRQIQGDVIIVGAGTSGSYLAWRLGQSGYRVVVLEARKLSDLGKHISVFHIEEVAFQEHGIPLPEGDELIRYCTSHYLWSPDLKIRHEVTFPFYIMHKPAFQQRMHRYVRESGGVIYDQAEVHELIFESGRLAGVRGTMGEEEFEARGQIIVDASGIKGAVRTRLPEHFGVENEPIGDGDTFFTCLEYRDGLPQPDAGNSYILYKSFWNPGYGDSSIFGIGQPGSYENAWEIHRQWREKYFGDSGRVIKRVQGRVPYRRPPFSLVGDGFLVLGDAAFQNKPFSGEGVPSAFAACRIAVETVGEALQKGCCSREDLWDYNVRYFRGQGAKFAGGLAQLPVAAELSWQDVNYLFHKGVIFNSKDFEELNDKYEISMGAGKLCKTALALVWGVLTGRFSGNSLKQLLKASQKSSLIKSHYLKFPEDPSLFDTWAAEAKRLWGEG